MFPCISWERSSFTFRPMKKDHVFGKKIPSFQIIQERSCADTALFGKTIFSRSLKKMYSLIKILFHFLSKCKIIFSGKGNIIFPNNTRKIMFQCNFFRKTIFSGVRKKKIWISVQWPMFGNHSLHYLHGQSISSHFLPLSLNWTSDLICLMSSSKSDNNCGDLSKQKFVGL